MEIEIEFIQVSQSKYECLLKERHKRGFLLCQIIMALDKYYRLARL